MVETISLTGLRPRALEVILSAMFILRSLPNTSTPQHLVAFLFQQTVVQLSPTRQRHKDLGTTIRMMSALTLLEISMSLIMADSQFQQTGELALQIKLRRRALETIGYSRYSLILKIIFMLPLWVDSLFQLTTALVSQIKLLPKDSETITCEEYM